MYICSQNLLSVSLSDYSVIKRNFNGNRSVSCKFMSDSEYSVIKSDVIKRFDFNLFLSVLILIMLDIFYVLHSSPIVIK